jgi:hypothetical protein
LQLPGGGRQLQRGKINLIEHSANRMNY